MPAEHAIRGIVTHRRDRSRPLDWIQIGSVAGPDISLPSAALRREPAHHGQRPGLRFNRGDRRRVGAEIAAGTLTVNATPLPLSQVETAWDAPTAPGERIVFTP